MNDNLLHLHADLPIAGKTFTLYGEELSSDKYYSEI